MIEVTRGNSPIVLGLPHTGTDVPSDIWDRLTPRGQELADTDWHIHTLYDGLLEGVTTIRTPVHRYVIDVNRAPDGGSLYPGQNTTGLCPLTDFDGQPIYRAGMEPDAEDIERRRQTYHAPYHEAVDKELHRVCGLHGVAILYDCHSIRSLIPYLFDGKLPDLNLGTNSGSSCGQKIEQVVENLCRDDARYDTVLNGRFKGGWTTRHYGRPETGVHAIQMELAQSTYMTEAAPWTYDPARADQLRGLLRTILKSLETLALSGDLT